MKDVKFVLGECTRMNTKYYFQYNNKVYFIIEKSPTQEKVLDRITNVRSAYEKWRGIKSESDDKCRKNGIDDCSESLAEKDYSYASLVFEYESDITSNNGKASKERIPKEKFKFEKITLEKNDDKAEKKKSGKRNDFEHKGHEERDRFKDERRRNEKKSFKKSSNMRYDKGTSYRRNEHRGDRQNHS